MTGEEIEAIVGGYHGDAFRVLGPHTLEQGWEVRVFLPQARTVSVLSDQGPVPMLRKNEAGFFLAELPGEAGPYQLQLERWDGTTEVIEDPYRFPLLLTEYEIHLHAEGTNYHSYQTLGAHLTAVKRVEGVRFAVWAPNAISVSVAGDFNEWDTRRHPMRMRNGGLWEIFLPGVQGGSSV